MDVFSKGVVDMATLLPLCQKRIKPIINTIMLDTVMSYAKYYGLHTIFCYDHINRCEANL